MLILEETDTQAPGFEGESASTLGVQSGYPGGLPKIAQEKVKL